MLPESRTKRRTIAVAGRALCFSTAVGLVCTLVPASVSASPVVIASPSTPNIVGLGEGAKGPEVRSVQEALITAGVPVPGGADGVYGPATQSAVTAFQSRKGLPATGTIDAATAAALGLATAPDAAPAPTPAPTPAALVAASPAPGAPVAGATGPAVVALQQALMAAGVWLPRGADGVFGAATTRGISNYQTWNRLTVSGVVDAPTFARLKLAAPAASPASPAPAPAAVASASTASTTSPFSGMRAGARGDNVRVLQRALIAAGITIRGGADGLFGAMTTAALTTFQRSKGLAASGLVDDATIAALALSPGAPAPTPAPAPAPPPVAASPYVGLTLGATGERVRELQRALMGTGLVLRGGADGSFGNATRTALIAFQTTNNVPQTGVVSEGDAKTLGLGSTSTAPQGVAPTSSFASFGERGVRVTTLQQALIAAGITIRGGADGIFGAATAGAIMEFQRRSGLAPTGKIDEQTANRLGSAPAPAPTPAPTVAVTIDVFPVQGRCWFGDTWMAPRGGGRLHEGVDIIAPKGNLLYAAVTGRISRIYTDFPGALAGNGLRIQQDNGTYFTYLHMDTFAAGIVLGAPVTAGQVIGTVGNTGNSATPHLHFEVHPGGGAAVNPFPLVKPIDACNVTAPRA